MNKPKPRNTQYARCTTKSTKRIFIAATGQNNGKTTVSLGLIMALKKRFKNVGFIKPIGQRYLIDSGYKVDEDSVFIEKVCGIDFNLKDMSPVAIERGYTEKYILRGKKEDSSRKILRSFKKIQRYADIIVIEGTGHAGVGSVCDWSNASVAKLVGSKVILISSGGIGRPIDEIVLNKALFDKEGVETLGVIINKVLPKKYKKVNRLLHLGLKKKGIKLFGVIPYVDMLSTPSVRLIKNELRLKLLCGKDGLDNNVRKTIVGAMEPHDALKYITPGSLVITPGDREDIILASLSSHAFKKSKKPHIAGMILTGGLMPQKDIFELLCRSNIAVLLSNNDTYTAASMVHDLIVKVQPQEEEKIGIIVDLIEKYVDVDRLLKVLRG